MKDIAPLIQTILWVALIGGIVWRYHKQIHALLESIQKRIDSGSGIKAGPFEIAAMLQPQNPEQQREKITQEISEAAKVEPTPSSTPVKLEPQYDLRTRYLQAEDLALRAIQAAYNIPISRQLQVGRDMQFDGFFAKDGTAHIVEVKYAQRPYLKSQFLQVVNKIFAGIGRYGWRNVKVIFVIVYG
ncbi:MAG: hypothetical protein EG826_13500, partial [Deltaproteobacteria bacterium]|nr:hypothetical protein [Deltaproteobacteria bacterium]